MCWVIPCVNMHLVVVYLVLIDHVCMCCFIGSELDRSYNCDLLHVTIMVTHEFINYHNRSL